MKVSHHPYATDTMKYENPEINGLAIPYAWHMFA